MKLLSIEPTPNPNSMKINLDETLGPGVSFTFIQKDKANYPEYVQKTMAIPGVDTIFQMNDFMAIQRLPHADWGSILGSIRMVLEGETRTSQKAIDEHTTLHERFGEVHIFMQVFRRIPMLVKVSNSIDEKRFALPQRFQDAISQASLASNNMLIERQWESLGIRYGTFDQVGEVVAEEIDATYDDKRLHLLVDGAFHYHPDQALETQSSEDELNEQLHSTDWRHRFAALSQIGANPKNVDLFITMSKDPKMNIRRLCIVYLGLIQGEKVFRPICEALKDDAVGVRRAAGDALTDLGDSRATAAMIVTLKDSNKLVRWRAARFLYEQGDERTLAALKEAADDPHFEVRMQIRQTIERIESGGSAQGTVWQQMTQQSNDNMD